MKKIFHMMKAVDSEHLTFVMENRLFHMRSTHCFFPNKHHILWEATKFEKILQLVLPKNFTNCTYNSARRKEENCNSLAGIGTSHLCYAMIQVILNEIDSLFFQIKVQILWED